jgi:hypothetical protein
MLFINQVCLHTGILFQIIIFIDHLSANFTHFLMTQPGWPGQRGMIDN